METVRNTLSKKERINSKKSIDLLFSGNASSMMAFPLRVLYMTVEENGEECYISVLTSVPKKRFKRAVKRNRIKRQVRESYRKNKHSLVEVMESKNQRLLIAFIYVDNQLHTSDIIEKSMRNVIEKLSDKFKNEAK